MRPIGNPLIIALVTLAISALSNVNPLDLIQRNLILHPVVELRRARRLVAGDPRSDLEVATIPQILGDSRAPEAVRANLGRQPSLPRPALDHPKRRRS